MFKKTESHQSWRVCLMQHQNSRFFGVQFERRKVDKKQTYTKTETCKLHSRVFWTFLPNDVKIDPYNFQLYRFKFKTFFWDTVYNCFSSFQILSSTTWVSWYQKGKTKTDLDFLEQESVSDSGISWAICKSALCPRQITMAAPHHSVFLQAGCPSCRTTNSVKALKAFAIQMLCVHNCTVLCKLYVCVCNSWLAISSVCKRVSDTQSGARCKCSQGEPCQLVSACCHLK